MLQLIVAKKSKKFSKRVPERKWFMVWLAAFVVLVCVMIILIKTEVRKEVVENSPLPEPKISSVVQDSLNSDAKKYISNALGVELYFPSNETSVREVGNKIYVYYKTDKYTDGQYVEVFTKKSNETFKDAIVRLVYKGEMSADCPILDTHPIISGKSKDGKQILIIQPVLGKDEGIDSDSYIEHVKSCPKNYYTSNGVWYFQYDPTYPTKMLFFSLGQYFMRVSHNTDWESTVNFTK